MNRIITVAKIIAVAKYIAVPFDQMTISGKKDAHRRKKALKDFFNNHQETSSVPQDQK